MMYTLVYKRNIDKIKNIDKRNEIAYTVKYKYKRFHINIK